MHLGLKIQAQEAKKSRISTGAENAVPPSLALERVLVRCDMPRVQSEGRLLYYKQCKMGRFRWSEKGNFTGAYSRATGGVTAGGFMSKLLGLSMVLQFLLLQAVTFADDNPNAMAAKVQQMTRVQAVAVLRKAEAGDAENQNLAGMLYELGHDEKQNATIAVQWYRKAAAQGLPAGQFNLGGMLLEGMGVEKDEKQAMSWFRKAAAQGYAPAESELGSAYSEGAGVQRDSKEALRWYQKAAAQHYAEAEYNIGVMYRDGEGVKQDCAEAGRWLQRASEHGEVEAQASLGTFYLMGKGVPQSNRKAFQWLSSAAEAGEPLAQFNLGMMYLHAIGIKQNYVAAYKWFTLAVALGFSIDGRNGFRSKMSPREIETAVAQSSDWLKSHGNLKTGLSH